MSVQSIVDKIKHDATVQADALRAHAAEQVSAIEARTAAEVAALEAAAATRLEKAKEHRRAVKQSLTEQAGNQRLYAAKRELVDSVIDQAFASVRDEPSEAYVRRFVSLLQPYAIDPADITVIKTAPNRTEEAATIATELGWGAVSVEADESLSGGLRVEGRAMAYDLSLERLFADQREALEVTVAQHLFAD